MKNNTLKFRSTSSAALATNLAAISVIYALAYSHSFAQTAGSLQSDSLSAAYQVIKSKLENSQVALDEARQEMKTILGEIDQQDELAAIAQREITNESQQITELQAEIESQNQSVINTQKQVSRVSELLNAKQNEISVLNQRLTALQAQRQAQAQQLASSSDIAQQRATQLVVTSDSIELENKKIQNLKSSIVEIETNLQQTSDAQQQAVGSDSQSELELGDNHRTLSQLRGEREELEAQQALKQQQLSLAKDELATTLQTMQQNDDAQASLVEQLKTLQANLTASSAQIDRTNRELATVQSQIDRTARLNQAKQQEVARLAAKLETLNAEQVSQNQNSNMGAADLQQKSQMLANLGIELQSATDQLASIERQLSTTEAALIAVEKDKVTALAAKQSDQIELDQLTLEVGRARTQTDQAQLTLESKQSELTLARQQLAATQAQIKDLQASKSQLVEMQSKPRTNVEIEQETAAANAELAELKKQLKQKNTLLEQELDAANDEVFTQTDQQDQIQRLERDNFTLWEEIGWTKLQIEQANGQLAKHQRKQRQAQVKLTKTKTAFDKQTEIATRLKHQHDQQLQEKADLEQQITATQAATIVIINQAAELKAGGKEQAELARQYKKRITKTKRELNKLQKQLLAVQR